MPVDDRSPAAGAVPGALIALRRLVEATGATTGQAFFDALVRNLPAALGVRYALVGELTRADQRQTRTLSVWWDGAPPYLFMTKRSRPSRKIKAPTNRPTPALSSSLMPCGSASAKTRACFEAVRN